MDLFTQNHAWGVSMTSAVAGCLSFFIALIANREKLADFFRKYWVAVLGAFAIAGGWSFYEFGGLMYLVNLWHGFAKWMSKGIPIWAIIVGVGVFFGIWFIFRAFANYRKNDGNTPQLAPEDFRVEDYSEDLIDGIWWKWTYSGNTVNVPRPICPDRNCQCDLIFREDWSRINDGPNVAITPHPPVFLFCPRCGFRKDFDQTERQVLGSVSAEIISQIRTGNYRGRLASQLANQQASARQNGS